jgi:cobalt-zinc-cadmium efflux system outer membrane protein
MLARGVGLEVEQFAAQTAVREARTELDRAQRVAALIGSGEGDHLGASGSAGFAVEIPLLDTRVGLTHRAASELRTAIVRQRAFAFETNSQTVSPRLAAVRQMAEDAYRLGRGSLVDLLDSTRVRHEARLDQLDQIGALMDSQWRIRVIRGDLLPRPR